MLQKSINLILSLSLIFIFACSKGPKATSSNIQLPTNLAPKEIDKSFKVNPEKKLIGIHESQVGDEKKLKSSTKKVEAETVGVVADAKAEEQKLGNWFLIRMSVITKMPVPSFTGMQSRLVRFEKAEKGLKMLESQKGQVAGTNPNDDIPLGSFEVVDKDDDGFLWFAYSSGVFWTEENWRASDYDGRQNEYSQAKEALGAVTLDKLEVYNNSVVIHQKGMGSKSTMELRTFISPYSPDKNYRPLGGSNFKDFGFFEVAPLMEKDGSSKIYSTRFNPNKKVKWYISKNTPPELYEAIKEGILYWNKVIGREWMEVVPNNDEGLSAPDMTKNVVQWVDFDNAGFAYADAQSDPLTGEILNAQVFMSSAFNVSSKERLLRKVRTTADELSALKGINGICDNQLSSFQRDLSRLVQTLNLSDEDILRLSQDYIREVVAHEIGHTLGLRHNFAGSLSASESPADLDKIYEKYVRDAKATPPKGLVITNSSMEYSIYKHAVLAGWQMKNADFKEENPFAYDRAIVSYLSDKNDNASIPQDLPPFCTDSSASALQDCLRFDEGRNVYEAAAAYTKFIKSDFRYAILEEFYTAANPVNTGDQPVSPKSLTIDVRNLNDRNTFTFRDAFLNSFSTARNFAKTRQNDTVITNGTTLSGAEQLRNEKASAEWLAALGEDFDFDQLSWKGRRSDIPALQADFDVIADKYLAKTKFSSDDKEHIKAKAKVLIEEYVKYAQEDYLTDLNREGRAKFLDNSGTALSFEENMEAYLTDIVLGKESVSEQARVMAAKTLRQGKGQSLSWARFSIAKTIATLREEGMAAAASPREAFKKAQLTKTLIQILSDEDSDAI